MRRSHRRLLGRLDLITPGLLLALAGCRGCAVEPPSPGQGHWPDSGGDVGDSGDSGQGPGDSGGETGTTQGDYLDEPGDVLTFDAEDATTEVDLADLSGDSNKDQDIYLVLVNRSSDPFTFSLAEQVSDGAPSSAGDTGAPPPARRASRGRRAARSGRLHPGPGGRRPPIAPPPDATITEDDIGVVERNFYVRTSLEDDEAYEVRPAVLGALGDSVAIWVDVGTGMDWDYDCDGVVDVVATEPEADGFDNCDLQVIADIVDANIIPNVRATFGEESDVNGDGRVNVVISPVLNEMTLAAEDDEDRSVPLWSYADPETDLTEWDAEANPYSNYQEVLFVFAPDPGYFNPLAAVDVEEYTSMRLAAQIARSFEQLVSYNNHVLRWESDPEDTWLREAMGALAADLTGFGAVYYDAAWDYVDATHLEPVVAEDTGGSLNTGSWGAQYLFLRYLVDVYGTELLALLTDTDQVGVDNVEGAVAALSGEEPSFDDLVLDFEVALLTSGVTGADGSALVDPDTWPPFQPASTVSAPTENPESGDLYGANGYQMGINIGGENRYMQGGTTDSPTEVAENNVTIGNTDFLTAAGSMAYSGYVVGGYGAAVVRLVDLQYDATKLVIAGSHADYFGAVIRWNDPDDQDWKIETIASATDQSNSALPALPEDGSPITVLGTIREPGTTQAIDEEGQVSEALVYDTDRYLLDLTDRPSSETVRVAVKLERHYDGSEPALYDPWVAVVPADWLPMPTPEGTARSSACPDGIDFAYPGSVLDYLYYQVFLSPTALSEQADFDPCGDQQDAETTCEEDWDRDGVLDVDEPRPSTLLQQVWVMQCTLAGRDIDAITPADESIFDFDETDEDDTAWTDRSLDLGGRTDDSGEDAFLYTDLAGGGEYVIVVGGNQDTGPYELTIWQVDAD